eukprot:1153763-Pelagomonas_calceolata.AAC.4
MECSGLPPLSTLLEAAASERDLQDRTQGGCSGWPIPSTLSPCLLNKERVQDQQGHKGTQSSQRQTGAKLAETQDKGAQSAEAQVLPCCAGTPGRGGQKG